MSTSNSHQSQPITQIPSRSPIPQTATLTPAPVLQICPPAPDTMTHPLSTGTTPADASSSHHTTSLEAQRTGGTSNADAQGIVTPPVPMIHLRALVISGESHVFTFEPETTVGRTKELIWSMWPSHWREPSQPPSPSFLRILHAGRILSDDSTLSSNNLPAALPPATPTVIHLSVRSFSIRAEDEPKKGSNLHPVNSRSGRNADEEVSGCKCVIM